MGENPPDPKKPGVWWNGLFAGMWKWKAFPEAAAESIFTAFSMGERVVYLGIGRKVYRYHVADLLYEVNLENMKASHGRWKGDVKIVQAAVTELNFAPCKFPIEVGVWWWDDVDDIWHVYSKCQGGDSGDKILDGLRKENHYAVTESITSEKWPKGMQYVVDLKKMKQMNIKTGSQRSIQIVGNVRADNECRPTKKKMRFTVPTLPTVSLLVGCVLDKLISRQMLELMLLSKIKDPRKLKSVGVNVNLQKAGGRHLYERFRKSFEEEVRKIPGYRGQLLRIVKELENPTASRLRFGSQTIWHCIRHVFHGTQEYNISSILNTGMDPARRKSSSGDCFGLQTDSCTSYCTPSPADMQMLVFLGDNAYNKAW